MLRPGYLEVSRVPDFNVQPHVEAAPKSRKERWMAAAARSGVDMPLPQLFSKNFVYFWPRQHPNGNGLQLSLLQRCL